MKKSDFGAWLFISCIVSGVITFYYEWYGVSLSCLYLGLIVYVKVQYYLVKELIKSGGGVNENYSFR